MAEIEVFGGGIFGLSVAYACLERGASVRVIEKHHIGAGASGGVVGALAPHTPDNWNAKKQFQFETLIAAPDYWAEIDAISGLSSGYGRIGRLMALDDDKAVALAKGRTVSAVELWHGLADWHVVSGVDYEGWAPPSATGLYSYDTLSARMSPRAACQSLARAFQRRGGEILEGCDTGKGADATVLCTGYQGLLDLSAALGQEIGKGVKGQGLSLQCDAGKMPQIQADGLHIIPHQDGSVAIGSTSEIVWQAGDTVDYQLDALHQKAVQILPCLADAPVLQRWAGVRPRGRRRAPMLGKHPLQDRVFIANGGFKIGFGVAIRIGQVMADLVLTGVADIPASFTVSANLD